MTTPGPWAAVYDGSGTYSVGHLAEPQAEQVCTIDAIDNRNAFEDACLIAAAPDLRDALAALMERFIVFDPSSGYGIWDRKAVDDVIAARAALRKSAGE